MTGDSGGAAAGRGIEKLTAGKVRPLCVCMAPGGRALDWRGEWADACLSAALEWEGRVLEDEGVLGWDAVETGAKAAVS